MGKTDERVDVDRVVREAAERRAVIDQEADRLKAATHNAVRVWELRKV